MVSALSSSLIIAFGGALGAVARFWTGQAASRLMGSGWPWGTFLVNVTGGLMMGGVVALAGRDLIGPAYRQFLTLGVLGGFTTFSAFSLDVVQLLDRGAWLPMLAYVVFSVALSVVGVILGLKIFA